MNKSLRYFLLRVLFRLSPLFPDVLYLRLQFYFYMGRRLDLKHPRTMDEKLQWLKLHQREPRFTEMVDKLAVKKLVSKSLGDEYVARVLAIWNSVDDIDISILPDKFVLKTTHSGGNTGVVICNDKKTFDFAAAQEKLRNAMKDDAYNRYREWPYLNVPKKIFAEEYLGDQLTDYKFFCFDGDADSVLVCIGRQEGHTKYYFFDKDWKLCPYNTYAIEACPDFTLPRPIHITQLFEMASQLSKGFPCLRVDFYEVGGRIFFGEYTFYPASGYHLAWLPGTDEHFGEKINLDLCKDHKG